jgi:hypothetical protein
MKNFVNNFVINFKLENNLNSFRLEVDIVDNFYRYRLYLNDNIIEEYIDEEEVDILYNKNKKFNIEEIYNYYLKLLVDKEYEFYFKNNINYNKFYIK